MKNNHEGLPYLSHNTESYSVENLTIHHMWCPYCGGWHGGGTSSPSKRTQQAPAPRIPAGIAKIIRTVMETETNVRWKSRAGEWQDTGLIDGEPAAIKTDGNRTRVIWDGTEKSHPDPYNHREIVTNDGLNASYVRDMDERVIVDDSKDDPYEPYTRDTSNRYMFE